MSKRRIKVKAQERVEVLEGAHRIKSSYGSDHLERTMLAGFGRLMHGQRSIIQWAVPLVRAEYASSEGEPVICQYEAYDKAAADRQMLLRE
ncbi:hypothetical protein AC579_9685 [Pseudocercospora musae]|uniref:Uncharacterized protein n=1 Tax=Pseudocercospora musae TaxID=113226 RepID=A0A139I5U9_9PEZI|nr:hypothetical protein AC579_9685 [Pseudocercospora musae]